MAIRIVQLGSARTADEGIRFGTVRRPPRGIPKSDFGRLDYYDRWLPLLSPSPERMKEAKNAVANGDAKAWVRFARAFRKDLERSEASQTLEVLAALSRQSNFSIGCYCEDESRCHRSVLRQLLIEQGAVVIRDA